MQQKQGNSGGGKGSSGNPSGGKASQSKSNQQSDAGKKGTKKGKDIQYFVFNIETNFLNNLQTKSIF